MAETKDSVQYLKIGDLVQMTGEDSIGYVTCELAPPQIPLQIGDEAKGMCNIRWIDGKLKTEGWISLSSQLKDGKTDMLTLITDKKKIQWYQERYPFVNSIAGTKSILNDDFPPQPR